MSVSGHEIFSGIVAARRVLSGRANLTPVARARSLDRMLGAEIVFKCENLQRTGAFKFRGALNAISRLDEAVHRRPSSLSISRQ